MQSNTTVHDTELEYLESLLQRLKSKENDAVSPKNQDEVELLKYSVQILGHAASLGRTLKNFASTTGEQATAVASVASTPLGQASNVLSSAPFVGIPFKLLADVLEACNNEQKVKVGIASYVGRLSDLTEGLHDVVKHVAVVGGEDIQRDTTFHKLKEAITDGIKALNDLEKERTSKMNFLFKSTKLRKAKGQLDKLKSINEDLDRRILVRLILEVLQAKQTREPEMRRLLQERFENFKDYIDDVLAPLLRTSSTKSTFPKSSFTVPSFSSDEYVSVRKNDLRDISNALLVNEQACVIVKGFAGIGKSWLVRRIGTQNNVVEKFNSGILWIKVGQDDMTKERLVGLLRKVYDHVKSADSAAAKFEDIDSGVMAINARIAGKSYLFVLDDVWKSGILEHISRIRAAFVVTTRNSLALRQRETKVFELHPELELNEAVDLLERRSGIKSNAATTDVATLLGCHAFTLGLAANLVLHPPFNGSWSGLKEVLEDRPALIDILNRKKEDNLGSDDARKATAFEIIDLSVASLHEVTPTSFFQLSIFTKDATFEQADYMLLGNKTAMQCKLQLGFLEGASLLHREGNGVYSLHRITWEFCFERLGESGREGLDEMIIRNWIKNNVVHNQEADEEQGSSIHPTHYIKNNMFRHIKRSQVLDKQLTEDIYRHPSIPLCFSALAIRLWNEFKFTKALPCAKMGEKLAQATFGREHESTASSLEVLGLIYLAMVKYPEASLAFKDAVSIQEEIHVTSEPLYIASLYSLADLLFIQAKYNEALLIYNKALLIQRKKYGDSHPNVATALSNIANVLINQGMFNKAERLLKTAKHILQVNGKDLSLVLTSLGSVSRHQGKLDEAMTMIIEALRIVEKRRKPVFSKCYEIGEFCALQSELALLLGDMGNYDDALEMGFAVLFLVKTAYGGSHHNIADHYDNIAHLLYSRDRSPLAARCAWPYLVQSLEINRNVFGKLHPAVAGSLTDLTIVLFAQGMNDDAHKAFNEARAITERLFGKVSIEYSKMLKTIGTYFLDEVLNL